MPDTTTHPSNADLAAFNLGQLPPDQASVIEDHIVECQPCCDTVLGLSSEDTFVGLLKEARQLPADATSDILTTDSDSDASSIPVELAKHPRYEVLELIGRGGMGDVYKARHRMMKRTVALKVIKPKFIRNPAAVDRFHREVTTAAQLSHPNIVTSHDAEQAGDLHFLVMEYVEGTDLSRTVRERAALPITEACDYIRQAATGLQYAHEQGMVHRDIKPHNLMVTPDGTVKILDFGLASLAPRSMSDADTPEVRGDLTSTGTVMGTPDFISPEQAVDARSADIRSDIYSLGSTLYFLLAGRPPFNEGSAMTRLKNHATEKPDALESLRNDVPKELTALIDRMTAKHPEERFQTPAEAARALESLSLAPPPPAKKSVALRPATRVKRFALRQRRALAAGIILLFAIVLLTFAAKYQFSTAGGFSLVSGGAGSGGNKWYVTSGATYLVENQPGVLFGTYESPSGRRGISYVVLFRHDVNESSAVGNASSSGLHFDGEIALATDGLTIDNKELTVALEAQMGKDEVQSTSLAVNGKQVDAAQGRLFLVDMTGDRMMCSQVDIECRVRDLEPRRVVEEIDYVTAVARQITEQLSENSEVVRNFLAETSREDPSPQQLSTANSIVDTAELRIVNHSRGPFTGEEFNYGWNISGKSIGAFDLRLMVVRNGETVVVQQYDCEGPAESCGGEITLNVEKKTDGAGHLFNAQVRDRLFGLPDRMSRKRHILPLQLDFPNDDRGVSKVNGDLVPGKTNILYSTCYSDGAVKYERTLNDIIEASKTGAVFVLLTVDWKPVAEAKAQQRQAGHGQPATADAPGFDGVDKELFGSEDGKQMFEWIAEFDPELVRGIAEKHIANGKEEAAKRVLSLDRAPDPNARAALEVAAIQLANGNTEAAADAFLDAYRISPSVLDKEHLPTIMEANRVHEFVGVFTEDRLRRLGYVNDVEPVVRSLLKNESTRDQGNLFLRRVWAAIPRTHFSLLHNQPSEVWDKVPDTVALIRQSVLPPDVASEEAGWERFKLSFTGPGGGTGSGIPFALRPLLRDDPAHKHSLRQLAGEVEANLEEYAQWKAGVALQGYLQALLGDEQRAVEQFERVLAETDDPIPPGSAWVFGQALENKGASLDQIVMRLYEKNVEAARDASTPLRTTAIRSLGRLYAKYGRRDDARRLLKRLAEPEGPRFGGTDSQFVLCGYSTQFGIIRETDVGFRVLSEDQLPQGSCIECHRNERNLENYILMANGLTDIGYPVDARIALALIGSSFSNAYGSDEAWAKTNTPVPDWEYQGREAFQPARAYAEQAITPRAMIEALDGDLLADKRPAEDRLVVDNNAPDVPRLDLMIGIRGEGGRSRLFSPVLDMIVQAAGKADSDRALDELDEKLTYVPPGHRKSLDEMIAVTVLSFERNRLAEAKLRAEQILASLNDNEVQPVDVALWFIAERALKFEPTRNLGRKLADRARVAAEQQDHPLLKEAVD